MKTHFLLALLALNVVPITASGADAPATQPAASSQNIGGVKDEAASKGTGTVSGTVLFKGEKPTPRPVTDIAGNAFCKSCFTNKPLPMKDNIVLGKNADANTVQNVLVYVSKGLEGKTFEVPKDHVVLDQVDCIYTPHVVAVMVGQTLDVKNSDATLHNVMAQPQQNKAFNFGMPVKNQIVERVFTKPEFKINTRCFMHPWMSAYVHVMEHPFFAVTGPDGSFSLKGLPPGEYEITVLHESSQLEATPSVQTIKVEADENKKVDFSYQLRAAN